MGGSSTGGAVLGAVLRTGALVAGLLVAVGGCAGGSSGSSGNSGNTVSVGSGTTTSTSTTRSRSSVSSSVSCSDDVCTIRVAGDLSGTRLGVLGRALRIEAIDADAVTVRVDGSGGTEVTRIPTGSTVTVGGLAVTAVSISSGAAAGGGGQEAELRVRRT